jgi:hypothetical protein
MKKDFSINQPYSGQNQAHFLSVYLYVKIYVIIAYRLTKTHLLGQDVNFN